MAIAPTSERFAGELERLAPAAGIEALKFDLDADDIDPGWAVARLAPSEVERANRLIGEVLQRRAATARALLRTVLAATLGAAPLELSFEIGDQGKPRLAGGSGAPAFNVSHAGPRLVIALSSRGEVGVDVELMGARRNFAVIARREFSERENAALDGLEGEAFERAFLRLWTLKESCVKALGVGMAGFDRIEASESACAGLTSVAWTPGAACVDAAVLDAFDVSSTDDIACVAVVC